MLRSPFSLELHRDVAIKSMANLLALDEGMEESVRATVWSAHGGRRALVGSCVVGGRASDEFFVHGTSGRQHNHI